MTQLVDDQLLSSILRGAAPPKPNAGLHDWPLVRPALPGSVGRSRPDGDALCSVLRPAGASPRARDRAIRELGAEIGQQRRRHDLNILVMEALASALRLDADVYLSAASPRLEAALRAEACRVTLIR